MARKYGRPHRRVRQRWELKLESAFASSGRFPCARGDDCLLGGWIRPHELWDLDHDDSDPLGKRIWARPTP